MTRNEALEIFEENIPEIRQGLVENMSYKISLLKRPKLTKGVSLFEVQSWAHILETQKITDKFRPFIRLIDMRMQPKIEGRIDQIDVDRAKEYPIETLLPTEVKRGMTLCPLHNEKTPSFQVKNNKFTCYGCGEHGDSIDLYQKLNNVTFLQAVKSLNGGV